METNKRVIVKSQLKEWVSSPIVEVIRSALNRKIDEHYTRRAELMLPGQPERTQEQRYMELGSEQALRDVIGLLLLEKDVLEEFFTMQGIEILVTEQERILEEDDE